LVYNSRNGKEDACVVGQEELLTVPAASSCLPPIETRLHVPRQDNGNH